MIKTANIQRLELTSRWVSVATSAILLGLQIVHLVIPSKEEPADDDKEK